MLIVSLILLTAVPNENPTPTSIGSKIDSASLRFKDVRYLERTLDDFGPRKATVLVFVTNECPLVRRYWPVIRELEKEHRAAGVVFAAVNVGNGDTIREMARQPIDFDVPIHFVKDSNAKFAVSLGVTITPTVVVLDNENVLRYRGRIDDQHRLGGSLPKATQSNLDDAIQAVLGGKSISTPETPTDGCAISTSVDPHSPAVPDAGASLVQKHCVECHTAGGSAPFALDSVEAVRKHRGMIAEVVADERMPPWYGLSKDRFQNHRGLTEDERKSILSWVKSGVQTTSKEVLKPLPPKLTDGWEIGKPDRVITMFGKHSIPATGFVDYKYVVLPTIFTHDVWVEAVEIRASNPRVLHHCNLGYGELAGDATRPGFITGKVPGNGAMRLDPGIALCIPKGAVLGLEAHYVTTGKPEECVLSVGLKFAKTPVQKRLRHLQIAAHRFSITAGDPFYKLSAGRKLPCDAVGVGMFCHMHVRGRDMTFIAHEPGKPPEELLCIPNYNFDWQQQYQYEPSRAKRLAKGTRVEAIAHYDNSKFNPFNPDPKRNVPEGRQTYDEMMFGFFFFVDADEKLGFAVDPKTGGEQRSEVGGQKSDLK
jgi:mono/diheme cytochrome c family protein